MRTNPREHSTARKLPSGTLTFAMLSLGEQILYRDKAHARIVRHLMARRFRHRLLREQVPPMFPIPRHERLAVLELRQRLALVEARSPFAFSEYRPLVDIVGRYDVDVVLRTRARVGAPPRAKPRRLYRKPARLRFAHNEHAHCFQHSSRTYTCYESYIYDSYFGQGACPTCQTSPRD